MGSQLVLVELPAEERAALQEVTARVARQLRASERFLGEVVEPPVPGSPIAEAFANGRRDEFGDSEGSYGSRAWRSEFAGGLS
jgi:hypothetical protein